MAKFTVIVKNPDSIEDSLRRAATEEVGCDVEGKDRDDCIDDLIEEKYEELKEASSKWIKYNEYINVEIDTEAGTATVLEA